ncbi:hypothetical protein GCM10027280_07910 [Micromonospora polyrhachis]
MSATAVAVLVVPTPPLPATNATTRGGPLGLPAVVENARSSVIRADPLPGVSVAIPLARGAVRRCGVGPASGGVGLDMVLPVVA